MRVHLGSLRSVGVATIWPTSFSVWRCVMGTATGRSTFVLHSRGSMSASKLLKLKWLKQWISLWVNHQAGGSKLPHHGQLQETSSRIVCRFSVVLPPFSKTKLHVWNNCPFSMSHCTTQTLPRMCLSFWHFLSSLYAVNLGEPCIVGSCWTYYIGLASSLPLQAALQSTARFIGIYSTVVYL